MKNTDQELISMYQQGNEAALSALIQTHQQALYSYIFYKVLNEDIANDIFQDTFVKIIVTLKEGRYTDEGKFVLWAKRIAHNLIIDSYRLKNKQNHVSDIWSDDEEFSIFDLIKDQEMNIEDLLVDQQIKSDLHKLIALLPQNQQEVIHMRFYQDLSFKEIAEATNTSINTTLGRVRYAILNVRKMAQENKIILSHS